MFEAFGWLFGVGAVLTVLTGVVIIAGGIVLEFLKYLFTVEIKGKKY